MAEGELTNRSAELVVWNGVITFLITFFLGWRLIERYKINPKLWLSDYLMIVAWILETAANICVILAAYSGYGRMDDDPYLTTERRSVALRYMYLSSTLCVYSMFIANLSICAFLMILNFSKGFRYVLWTSVVIIVIFHGICGTINVFGGCWPIAVRWDPNVKGKCWPLAERLWSVNMQSAANIIIDLIYAASPLVYIRQIRVSQRTRLGIQFIFLLALMGTAISIAKVVVLGHDMSAKTNILYVNVDGSIVAGAEFGIALIVGCLPPLRKPLERIFKRILPDNLVERKEKSPSFVLPYFSTRGTQETAATGESHPTIFYQERTNRSDIFSAEEQENHSRSVSVKTPRTAVEDRPGSPSSIG